MQPLELVDVALVGLHQQHVHLVQIVAIFGGGIGEALAQLLHMLSALTTGSALLMHVLLRRSTAVAVPGAGN